MTPRNIQAILSDLNAISVDQAAQANAYHFGLRKQNDQDKARLTQYKKLMDDFDSYCKKVINDYLIMAKEGNVSPNPDAVLKNDLRGHLQNANILTTRELYASFLAKIELLAPLIANRGNLLNLKKALDANFNRTVTLQCSQFFGKNAAKDARAVVYNIAAELVTTSKKAADETKDINDSNYNIAYGALIGAAVLVIAATAVLSGGATAPLLLGFLGLASWSAPAAVAVCIASATAIGAFIGAGFNAAKNFFAKPNQPRVAKVVAANVVDYNSHDNDVPKSTPSSSAATIGTLKQSENKQTIHDADFDSDDENVKFVPTVVDETGRLHQFIVSTANAQTNLRNSSAQVPNLDVSGSPKNN
jgi:hypothetical protein